jgi:hypothetical protein
MFHQVARRTNDDIETVHTGLDSDFGILKVASDVGEDLGLEAEFADGLAVFTGLLACGGASELDVYTPS